MPSDANGVYTLPDGYLAVTGDAILASQHNPSLEDLAESMSNRIMASGAKPFTGPAKFADGTVSAPGLTMASATSSGWYKTTDGWGFSIGGAMVAEITAGGIRTGARYLGELIPFTGLTAPALTVLAYGQTLSRTTYAALWVFAQTEIAAGNTFYNNGDGSTTFGIGDCRGRVLGTKDNLGGSVANRLTTFGSGVDGATLGAAGGSQSTTLLTANLPAYTPSGTVAADSVPTNIGQGPLVSITPPGTGPTPYKVFVDGSSGFGGVHSTGTLTGNAQGGTSTPFSGVQPTIVVTHLLFAGA